MRAYSREIANHQQALATDYHRPLSVTRNLARQKVIIIRVYLYIQRGPDSISQLNDSPCETPTPTPSPNTLIVIVQKLYQRLVGTETPT
jgi:hypothetical protein